MGRGRGGFGKCVREGGACASSGYSGRGFDGFVFREGSLAAGHGWLVSEETNGGG